MPSKLPKLIIRMSPAQKEAYNKAVKDHNEKNGTNRSRSYYALSLLIEHVPGMPDVEIKRGGKRETLEED